MMFAISFAISANLLVPAWTVPPPMVWLRFGLSLLIAHAAIIGLFQRAQLIVRRALETQLGALEQERLVEAERARLMAIAARTQHLEGLGRLAGGVGHDRAALARCRRRSLDRGRGRWRRNGGSRTPPSLRAVLHYQERG